MINNIHNEDCFATMEKMFNDTVEPDLILTSPPYNTSRKIRTQKSMDNYECRYDIYADQKTDKEYLDWSIDLFNNFDKILKKDGVILYNVSYGSEFNSNLMFLLVSTIIKDTPFMIGDVIIWKKKSALPNNVSPNKLTRIIEFVFVFCRKDEYKTYYANKPIKGVRKTGQLSYCSISNFIDAANNDGPCKLNKATFSTELCEKLLNIYARQRSLVFDPFMGSGTTAVACKKLGHDYIGSEISQNQCEYSKNRINKLNA